LIIAAARGRCEYSTNSTLTSGRLQHCGTISTPEPVWGLVRLSRRLGLWNTIRAAGRAGVHHVQTLILLVMHSDRNVVSLIMAINLREHLSAQ
jgi:hypothetical protein